MALYKFSGQGSNDKPYFTRWISETYAGYKTQWAQRNDTHTRAMEQAAADRSLFIHETNNNVRHVDLRYPEYVVYNMLSMPRLERAWNRAALPRHFVLSVKVVKVQGLTVYSQTIQPLQPMERASRSRWCQLGCLD